MSAAAPREVDVAIVGCGPTGALLANLLGQSGVRVAVLERQAGPNHLPRAIHYDGEVARILQSVGLAKPMSQVARPAAQGTKFMNPAGQTLMFRPGFEGDGPHGWPANSYIHQPNLEAVLREGLARFPNVELLSCHEVLEIAENGHGALVHATDTASGGTCSVQARYIVGADGARSIVRKAIGGEMADLGLHQPWLVVDVLVDPASERARAMPEYSIQLCDPARPMTIIYVEGDRRRWEIMLMPGDDPERMADPEIFWPLIARWIGPEDAEIERSAVYTFHALIASPWRRGALLLAGDACHQTPPFLGQGMCAGMRDAANLAWKLALVLRGEADPALLDSYESERSPHVAAFIHLAVELGAVLQTTDPEQAVERDARMTGGDPVIIRVPEPHLGPGAWLPGPPANGSIFPQPRLRDGRLLDAAIGGRFALVGDPALLDCAAFPFDVAKVPADSADLVDALGKRGAAAVLLRPDGYVFATINTAAELAALAHQLPAALHRSESRTAAKEDA